MQKTLLLKDNVWLRVERESDNLRYLPLLFERERELPGKAQYQRFRVLVAPLLEQ